MNMDDEADRSPNQNLNCDQGPMSSSGLTEFDSHHGSHREDRPYKCNQCDKIYRHAGSLVNHKKTHQVGLYTCLICQKEYSNPMGLKSHLRTHSEEKRFKCEQCGEAFRMSQQLYNHRKSLHAYYSTPNAEKITRNAKFETQSPVLVESSNLMTNLENYIAESMLPVDFPQLVSKYPDEKAGDEAPVKEESVEYEAFTDEKDQPNDSSMEEYRYKCTQCEKAYKHAGSLANHKQSHVIGVYQCAVCFKEFSNLMAMKNHCRLHSDSRARRSCKSPLTSGKNAGGHLDLTDCLQPVEKANRPPSLPDLSKQIKSEDQDSVPVLETHWHYGPESLSPVTKPNHDDVTDIPFGSDSAIDANEDDAKEKTNDFAEYEDANDEDSKSGVRPFTCQECGKSYRHAGSLINHKKTHQTGVYSCSLCSKKMFNMAALKNHLRAHFKSKAGKRLEDAHFPSASLSDDVCQNQEDSFEYGNSDISTNERDFLKHHFLHQKQEINEILIDNLVEEEVPESGIWHETPQVSQASSDDSAYSSGPALPEAKMEMDSLAFQPSSQEVSLATEFEVKLERKDDDDLQNADTSVAIPQPDPVSLKEEESSGLEEHLQSPDDRPHKCELCGRTYRHKSSLINHKLTHKTGVYQCSICPKQYSNLMALRNHVRFHSRSYAGRKSISSRQGHQFFRTRPRFLQSKSHSLANSVKLNERIPQRATTSQRAGKQLLHEAQVLCTFGMLFNHSENFQSSRRSCLSAISVTPAKTPTNAQSTSPEKDLFKVKEEEPHKKITGTSENPGRRVYKCNLCSKSYRHSGSLINHKRTHQTGDYACPYCSKHVHNMAALKNHIRIHHKIKKSEPKEMSDQALLYSDLSYPSDAKGVYGCVSCREMFHTENDLLAHQMVHAPLEGDRWDDQVHKSSSTEVKKDVNFTGMGDSEWDHSSNLGIKGEHLDSAAEDQEPEYTCVECGEVYDHIDDLNYHKRSHQAGIFQCSFCPKEYPSLSALRSHFETHTKPQTLRTTVLGGSDGNDFVDHQVPADKQYDCGHCGLIFSNEVDFHQHQVAHEKQQRMAESLPEIQEVQEPEFSFSMHSSERELLNRIKSEIEETERSGNLDGGSQLSHICGFCGETYDDLESLKAHSFIHRNGEDFSANENIPPKPDENHQQPCSESSPKNGEIPERRPYTCEQCGKTYRHGGSLVNHKKTHLVGNFQCVACSRHYPNLAAYRTHLRHHPNCKRSSAVNNLHDLQTSTLQDHRYPSGNDKSLPFSPYLPADSLSPHGPDKCTNYATSVSPSSKTTLHKKNSMRLFSHPVGSISADQITQQTSTSLAHSVEDSKVQACKLCGKMFPVKDLALHLSYNCVRALSRLQDALVECKEEIHDLPVLPDIARPQTEQEPGFQKRPFRCEVCSRSYRHAGSLINHKQTHKTGIFRCPICQKRFFNLMAMKNHNRIHFELKRHKCLDCGKAFRLQKQLDTHQRIHRQRASAKKPGRRNRKSRHRRFAHKKSIMQVPSEASSIEKVIGTGEMRSASRLKSKMDPDSRPYQCHECGRSYRHAGSLFNHKKSHKTGQYHCSICDKTYRNLMALKNHQRTHYEAKRHPCSQCGKTFKWRRQLFRHQIVHVPQGSQSDSQIPSGTEAKAITDQQVENSTNGHEASNFNNEDVSNGANELESRSCEENSSDVSAKSGAKESSQSEEPHGCDVCGHIDRHGGSLCRHMSKRESGKYKCSVCPEEFLNPIAMSTHLLTHSPEKHRQGVNCEQTVQSSQDLIIHNTVHVEGNPFRCPTCNHGFSCERTLRHHQRTHEQLSSQSSSLVSSTQRPNNEKKTSPSDEKSPNHKDQGDRKYKCKQCTRSYLHASSLFNHQKTHSIGVYKCPNCLKEFFNLLAFKNHLRIHRYNCKECGKAFRNSSDLVAHSETHQEGSFTCSLCNKHFLCRSSLKNHQRIHDNQDGDILDPQAVSKFMVEVT